MYIFECLFKLLKKKSQNTEEFNYNPLQEAKQEDYERCNHEFMPVDSTGETLACIKCGFIVQRSKINEVKYDTDD